MHTELAKQNYPVDVSTASPETSECVRGIVTPLPTEIKLKGASVKGLSRTNIGVVVMRPALSGVGENVVGGHIARPAVEINSFAFNVVDNIGVADHTTHLREKNSTRTLRLNALG